MPAAAFPIDVPFKASRDYLRGADIFTVLMRETGASHDISLKFTRLVSEPIEAVPAAAVAAPDAAPARFRAASAAGPIDLVVRPSGAGGAIERVAFDEDAIAKPARLTGAVIESDDGSAALGDRLVALNKRLILESVQPGKRMILTSIALSRLPGSANLRLELKSRLGVRLFRSAIACDGEALGEIIFYGA